MRPFIRLRGPRVYKSVPLAGGFRASAGLGCALYIAAALVLVASRLWAQDTLLVDVRLTTTDQHVMVDAVLEADSTLRLPAQPVHELLGLGTPTTQWVTPHDLEAAYRAVKVVWAPRELRVYVFDPLTSLPASRSAQAAIIAQSQAVPPLSVQSGPFMSVAVDDSARSLIDVGYSWRGVVAVAGRADNHRATAFGLTFVPSSHLFISYQRAASGPPNVSGRVSAGPFWLFSTYSPHQQRPLDMSGLLRVGDMSLYAGRDYGVVTINRSHQLTVQLAHSWEPSRSTAARVSVGPSWASPFTFPNTSLVRR